LLNNLIQEACKYEKKLKVCLLEPSMINFKVTSNDRNDFCFFKYEPLTNTGKMSKYPLILNFHTKEDKILGEIYYIDNDVIGKARVICWINHHLFVLSIKSKNNALSLSTLETKDDQGNKITLFKQKE
jgi:hypothetical protein